MLWFGVLVLFAGATFVEGLSPAVQELKRAVANARPKIDFEDKVAFSPLHAAAKKCHTEVVKALIDFGANPLLTDGEQNTPLHLAPGCSNVTSYLVHFGGDLDARNVDYATPLHLAVRAKDLTSISILLKNGAQTDLQDKRGVSVIDEVLASKDENIINIFKDNNVSLTLPEERIAEITTTEKVLYTIPKKLLTTTSPSKISTRSPKPLRVRLKRPEGKERELLDAARHGLEGKIVDLCSDGIDPNFADVTDNNYTPLHLATIAQAFSAMLTLIACGAKVDSIDRDSNTPLHLAAMNNNSWGAAVLLMRGADPYISQRGFKSPYQIVKEKKDIGTMSVFNEELLAWYNDVRPLTEIEKELHLYTKMGRYASGIAKLCIAGLNVNIKNSENKQRTALHIAVLAEYNALQTVQMLVRCGGNVNARDIDGNTPLHLAAMEGKDSAYTGLLLHKADPFLVNFEGKTAYQLSEISKSEYISYMAKFASHRYEWFMNNKFL